MIRKPTKVMLREKLRVFNSHNFCSAGGGFVWVCYTPQTTGRGYRAASWQVVRIDGKPTNPGGPWYDNGWKTFSVYGREYRELRRVEAIAWATEKFGIAKWVRDPFGDWQDASVYAEVVRRLNGLEQTR